MLFAEDPYVVTDQPVTGNNYLLLMLKQKLAWNRVGIRGMLHSLSR
jgi:hypothetical protein